MLKTTAQKIVFGCALGLLAGLLVVALESDFGGQICEYDQATRSEYCTTYRFLPFLLIQLGKTLNDYGVAITALATVAIGAFTLTLKLSTDKLWKAAKDQITAAENAAKIQSADMNASIAIAKEAAEAAKLYAQAAIGVELPRLLVSKVEFPTEQAKSGLYKICITITNYGRTPAYLTHEAAEIRDGRLPEVPDYTNIVNLGPGTLIEKDGTRILSQEASINRLCLIKLSSPRSFGVGLRRSSVFRDFLDNPHAARFCLQLEGQDGPGLCLFVIQNGPKAYTESY